MRIHSDILTVNDIHDACRVARVSTDRFVVRGSKSRERGFDITLEGESNRRPNNRGQSDGFAATWDQWGVFLAVLFERDENMLTPYYKDATDFAFQTADRFGAPEVVMGDDGYVDKFKAYGWPEDAHGDHVFRYNGTPREQSCTRCGAKKRWAA